MTTDATAEWEETRALELRNKATAMRVKARVNVAYYQDRAEKLNRKIRIVNAMTAVVGVVVAGMVPWVLKVEPLMYVSAVLALVGPVLMGWTKAKNWGGDLVACTKASDMSHSLEKEVEFLVERIDLREYESTSDMVRQYQYLQQKWESVGHAVPAEVPDPGKIKEFQARAEKSLGLIKDDGAKKATHTAPAVA